MKITKFIFTERMMLYRADELMQQDRMVLASKKIMQVLDIHPFADGKIKILLGERSPFIDKKDNKTGTIYRGIEVSNQQLSKIFYLLANTDKNYYRKDLGQRSYQIISDNQDLLSIREQECIFYLLRGKTAKEIGKLLKLSYRTIETHINNIKSKLKCKSRHEMMEIAIFRGYLNMVPNNLNEANLTFIL